MDHAERQRGGHWAALHRAFHRPEEPAYRRIEVAVWVLIVVSIGLLIAESMLDGHPILPLLYGIDRALLVCFVFEIVLRVATYAPPVLKVWNLSPSQRALAHFTARLRFLLSPMMLVDVLTVLALVPALRGLRALRLLRLMRSVKVFRYANPFQGLFRAFEQDRLLFLFAFLVLGVQAVLGGVSLYLVEGGPDGAAQTPLEGIWWALVTLTTVGYGDITPASDIGRALASALMVGGMFTLALFAGIVGHSLLNAVLSIREEQFRMSGYVDHIVLCGYHRGASMLLEAISEEIDTEETRIVIFAPGQRPEDVPAEFHWLSGDPTKESELDKLRLVHARTVVLAGDRSVSPQMADATTLLTAFTVRSYMQKQDGVERRKKPLYVIAEILDAENVDHARAAGVDEVVQSRRLGFSMVAHALAFPGAGDVASSVVLAGAQNLYIGRPSSALGEGARFGDVAASLRDEHGAMLIGIRVAGEGDTINPGDDALVAPGAHLIYLAACPCLPPP